MSDDTSPIRFDPSKSGYSREDSKTKPTGASGGKDFSRIMSKNEREGKSSGGRKQVKSEEDLMEEGEDGAKLEGEEESAPVSLFDMSKAQGSKLQKPVAKNSKANAGSAKSSSTIAGASQKEGRPSPAMLMGTGNNNEAKQEVDSGNDVPLDPDRVGQAEIQKPQRQVPARPFDLISSASKEMAPRTEKTPAQKGKTQTLFSREQPDLAAVNPMAIPQQDIAMNMEMKAEKPVAPVRPIQELIDQMVKEVQRMDAEGQTDTTVTLKYPPLFEGAKLVLTSFDSARGEFNISFENLTQAAQQVLSMQVNRQSLLSTLEQKGYHVHILSASTLEEKQIFTANIDDTRQERERRQQEEREEGREEQ